MAQFECPQCGAPLSPTDTQCPYCGENVMPTSSEAGAANPNMYQQPNPNMYQQPNQNMYQQPNQNYYQQPMPNQQMYQQGPNGYNQYNGQPMYQNPYGNAQPYDPSINPAWPLKNKIAAGVLGIILGGLGIHKFYLGKVGSGIVYLLFCWTGIPALIGFIEGIIYLCSNDHNFQLKHQVRLH